MFGVLLPWAALALWVVFWLFAVDWNKLCGLLRLRAGGWVPVLLLGAGMVLVWGTVAPPPDGSCHLLGLTLTNFVEKTVYVAGLFCIAIFCGVAQMSGCSTCWRGR